MKQIPASVKAIPTAKESAIYGITSEFQDFIELVGNGFHPDTDFEDYYNFKTSRPIFSKQKCNELNKRMDECFSLAEAYGIDVYEIAINQIDNY